VTVQQLRYFAAVAQYLHFGRAAKACYISQPSLSHAISELETELNIKLVERDSRTVSLTPAGKSLYEDAQEILKSIDAAIIRARRADSGFTGSLHIAALGGLAAESLPVFISNFRKKYPTVDITFTQTNMKNINMQLQTGVIDVAMTRELDIIHQPNEIQWATIFQDRFGLVVQKSDPLCSEKTISLANLKERSFIFLDQAVTPHVFDYTMQLCTSRGLLPRIDYTAETLEIACALIKSNLGIAVLPQCADAYSHGQLQFIPLDGDDTISNVVLAWNRQNSNPAAAMFLQEFDIEMY